MDFFKTCFEPETHGGFNFDEPPASRLPSEPPSRMNRTEQPSRIGFGEQGRSFQKEGARVSMVPSRTHFNFNKQARSVPNKLKGRSKRGQRQSGQAQAAENDSYREFLGKKQSDLQLWGHTFADFQQ
jgi:hypothetical protein